ncbi:hypothetical protein H2248_010494 [Termitomyces sp. 'cryptogamus']|nr:hypothetical protein H2248_010494 [Termitomyces sp. 'cryptogamus']
MDGHKHHQHSVEEDSMLSGPVYHVMSAQGRWGGNEVDLQRIPHHPEVALLPRTLPHPPAPTTPPISACASKSPIHTCNSWSYDSCSMAVPTAISLSLCAMSLSLCTLSCSLQTNLLPTLWASQHAPRHISFSVLSALGTNPPNPNHAPRDLPQPIPANNDLASTHTFSYIDKLENPGREPAPQDKAPGLL